MRTVGAEYPIHKLLVDAVLVFPASLSHSLSLITCLTIYILSVSNKYVYYTQGSPSPAA